MPAKRAAIFGASGGIGAALARVLVDRGVPVLAGSRSGDVPRHALITPFAFDLGDEASIADAARVLSNDPPDLVIVATGMLTGADGTGPERSLRQIDAAGMAQMLAVNTIGPALVAKHVLPLLARDRRTVFAAIGARVGSITDNRLGGWHSYRASKAALAMLVRNFAIEMRRANEQAIVVALHPGTVDTPLSRPFQSNLPEGQLTTARAAALNLLAVIDALEAKDSGAHFDWNGTLVAP